MRTLQRSELYIALKCSVKATIYLVPQEGFDPQPIIINQASTLIQHNSRCRLWGLVALVRIWTLHLKAMRPGQSGLSE